VLTADRRRRLFRGLGGRANDGKRTANWVINEVRPRQQGRSHAIATSRPGGATRRHPRLIGSDEISGKIAKDVFEIVYTDGRRPAEIVETEGMKQVTDTGAIEAAVDRSSPTTPRRSKRPRPTPSSRAGSWAR
jgi:aspartyl-tRNA(Asn)/glutamyl-tRNA(Gln) amidotransferase subunit B